jgi:CRP-like cAMP-binding protein
MMSVNLPPVQPHPPRNSMEQPRLFDRRMQLPLSSDQLWQIESGVVRTYTWTENGDLITLGIWGSGDVVGSALASSEPYQAECLTKVSAVLVPRNLWYQFTDALIRQIRMTKELIEIIRYGNAEVSFLRLLTWLAVRFGHASDQGWQIDLRLTHQELAEISGFTRVTVTRLLRTFEEQGLIQRSQRQILVLPERQPFWHYEI